MCCFVFTVKPYGLVFSYFNLWRTLPHANTHDFSSTHSNIANTAPPTACKRKVVGYIKRLTSHHASTTHSNEQRTCITRRSHADTVVRVRAPLERAILAKPARGSAARRPPVTA